MGVAVWLSLGEKLSINGKGGDLGDICSQQVRKSY